LRRGRQAFLVTAVLVEVAALRARGYGPLGGNVLVRCRRGHLFTTLWIPGASFKSIRLGWWRLQRCPVGRHWSIVTPVNRSELADAERRSAAAWKDIRIP
jgi:hypothetical protein